MTSPTPPDSPSATEDTPSTRVQNPGPPHVAPVVWGQPVPNAFPTPAPEPVLKRKKHLIFGAGGLVVGLTAGLLLSAVGGAVGDALASSNAMEDAVKTCSAADMDGVDVMDKGTSLNLSTAGKESEGTSMVTVVCVLTELEAPDSLFARMDSTRAMDGTQDATWENYTASWNYHPDSGLNITVETATK